MAEELLWTDMLVLLLCLQTKVYKYQDQIGINYNTWIWQYTMQINLKQYYLKILLPSIKL